MKNHWKLLTSILLALLVVVGLSACGGSLQKPTGLEKVEDQQLEREESQPTEADETETDSKGNASKGTVEENSEVALSDADKDDPATSETEKSSTEPTIDSKEGNKTTSSKNQTKTSTPSANVTEKSTGNKAEKVTEPAKSDVTKNPAKKPIEKNEQPKKKPTETPKSEPKPKPKPKPNPEPAKSTIVHSIVISSSEVPLPPTEMEIKDGDTVLQALISITMANKIHMDYRGGQGATAYVQGMGNVYEFDRGQGSGWMYRVNGIFPDRGAGVVPLLDGDRVEWLYTTNLGVDLGADLKPFRR